jgi:hypothetical protein
VPSNPTSVPQGNTNFHAVSMGHAVLSVLLKPPDSPWALPWGWTKNFPPNFNFHLTFHRESALGVTKGKSRPHDRGIFVRLQQMQHPTPQTTLLCAKWWGNCSMEGASCWRNLLHHYISANQLQETREGLRCKWFESQIAALVPKNYTVMCYTPSRT